MTWVKKLDSSWIGLAAGIVFPFVMFFLYWLFFHNQLAFPGRFLRYLMLGHLLSNVIKMCTLGNLLLFYFGLSYKIDRFSKGVVFSVLLYVALIAYVTYYHEPEIL